MAVWGVRFGVQSFTCWVSSFCFRVLGVGFKALGFTV